MHGLLFAACPLHQPCYTKCGFSTQHVWPFIEQELTKENAIIIRRMMWVPHARLAEHLLLTALAQYRRGSLYDIFSVEDDILQKAFDSVVESFRVLTKSNSDLQEPQYVFIHEHVPKQSENNELSSIQNLTHRMHKIRHSNLKTMTSFSQNLRVSQSHQDHINVGWESDTSLSSSGEISPNIMANHTKKPFDRNETDKACEEYAAASLQNKNKLSNQLVRTNPNVHRHPDILELLHLLKKASSECNVDALTMQRGVLRAMEIISTNCEKQK